MCEVVKCENVYCVIQTIQCVPFSEYPKKTSRKLFDSSKRYVPAPPSLNTLKEGLNVEKKVECCVVYESCGFHVLNLEFQHREIFFFSRKLLFFSLFLSLCSSDSPLSLSIENLTTFTTTQILFISNQIK